MSITRKSLLAFWIAKGVAPLVAMLIASMVMSVGSLRAQGLPIIRDTEIEDLLQDYSRPIFEAAGFGGGRVAVRIINNDSFNAFVLDGSNVFVNTGTLMQANTPNEAIGVFAHESGHIAGGHMAALRSRVAKDQTRALLTQVLGIAAVVAGSVTGGNAGREAMQGGSAILQGGSSVIMKGLLAERRSQESAADQAGMKYLIATRQSGKGMLDTFERFKEQEYPSDQFQDLFIRSHPLSAERLARLSQLAITSPYFNQKDPPLLRLRHDLMRAKLSGYLEAPATVFNRYPKSNKRLPARYAWAIATFFRGGPGALESAIKQTNGMIHENPWYPYFYELRADFLMRSGKLAAAVPSLRQALKLAPNSPLIRVELATAVQSVNSVDAQKEAIEMLRKSLIEDPENGRAYRLLADIYYKQGRGPEADAMTAQALFNEGNIKQAQVFAKRARLKLHSGSPEWLKSDDIIDYKP